ncbi:hypothetical protein EDM68_00795 [Candidatus Uhrbacteria bacterium]|nr:MAG: hypothetical protein EDM68_00795 [Candidatus Uhrbacteria bacterium]
MASLTDKSDTVTLMTDLFTIRKGGRVADEIEHRFIVEELDESALATAIAFTIEQAYLDTMPGESLRLRRTILADGTERVSLAHKRGTGLVRDEYEREIDGRLFEELFARCPHRIRKTRRVLDGWEVDAFHGPLEGLVVAEFEKRSADEPLVLPPWIGRAHEVTDVVNNLTLARLATELEEDAGDRMPVHLHLPRPMPRVVLTGGPGSGKSTMIEAFRRDPNIGPRVAFVPEAASIVIAQVGIRPPDRAVDRVGHARFQRRLAEAQMIFEDGATDQAFTDGKKAVILDRGLLDNAAYFKDGVSDFERCTRLDVATLARRYRAVIKLNVPPREVYERIRGNNPARSESYDEALALDRRIEACWKPYASVYHCPESERALDWNGKLSGARMFLLGVLERHT